MVFACEFMDLLGDIPEEARPLKVFDKERRQKLMQLAALLLQTEDNESTERTVKYLMDLCNVDKVPDPGPPLPWLSVRSQGEFDALIKFDPGQPLMGKVIPQMYFTARMQKRR